MTIVFCVDDKNGLLFAGKRQSKDRVLRERLLRHASGRNLWMSTYSALQFEEDASFRVDDDCLAHAERDDICFLEQAIIPLQNADRIILYRWNRHYPATAFFTEDLEALGFVKTSSEEFAGYSHETITEDIYTR